jgi:putative component of membrane protein insertase Oxa1/YidC/SpoIIIJ protein YidD
MILKIRISIIFLFLLWFQNSRAQEIHPSDFSDAFHTHTQKPKWEAAKNNRNELQMVFSGLFLFFKFAISSQDYNRCAFHPSCSEFGLLAVKKHGALIGMLATLDRLQRCNGMSPENYETDQVRMVLIDQP